MRANTDAPWSGNASRRSWSIVMTETAVLSTSTWPVESTIKPRGAGTTTSPG